MLLRQTYLARQKRNLSIVMGDPSSSLQTSLDEYLAVFQRMGGNAIHLHGEGGETTTRQATGRWLSYHNARHAFFLCSQICHDTWDEIAQRPIDRFSPEALQQDITTDLELLNTNYLDMVYLDVRPNLAFEPLIEALGAEIATGRVRSFGVRNISPQRLRDAHNFAIEVMGQGIAALITTELSMFTPNHTLWPEYVPFQDDLRRAVLDLELTVLAHADDLNLGQCLFGDEDPLARFRPEWISRWENPGNRAIASRAQEVATIQNRTTREIQVAWLLNQPFPTIAVVGLPSLCTEVGLQYARASAMKPDEINQIHTSLDPIATRFEADLPLP